MPKAKALVALQRSILIIIFHLLTDPTTEFTDLGPDFYTRRIDLARRTNHLTHQPPDPPTPGPGLHRPAHPHQDRLNPPEPTPTGSPPGGPFPPSRLRDTSHAEPAIPFARPRLGFPVSQAVPRRVRTRHRRSNECARCAVCQRQLRSRASGQRQVAYSARPGLPGIAAIVAGAVVVKQDGHVVDRIFLR